MFTSSQWIKHFEVNARQKRVNWNVLPAITKDELNVILPSLQAWQLGETSEGKHLIAASEKYASKISDPVYVDAVKLFIKEEQKHGHNLGCYLDSIGQPRIKYNWGDTLFRKVRYFNTSMELWTLAVIVVESTAQIFYQALKDATKCELLKSICTDILIDEAYHIAFQTDRLAIIYGAKNNFSRAWRKIFYKYFFYFTSSLVWLAHKKIFKAGGNTFDSYTVKMNFKYMKTISKVMEKATMQLTCPL